jgi:hypothetical protein
VTPIVPSRLKKLENPVPDLSCALMPVAGEKRRFVLAIMTMIV